MSEPEAGTERTKKTPWHIWVVGILTLLWNGSGAITITMAQLGMLTNITEEEAAYYAAQPVWFELLTNVSTYGALFAGVALLLRTQYAFWLFGISLSTIVITNLYDLATGSSMALVNNGAMVVTIIIFVIACLQLFYSWRQKNKGILR